MRSRYYNIFYRLILIFIWIFLCVAVSYGYSIKHRKHKKDNKNNSDSFLGLPDHIVNKTINWNIKGKLEGAYIPHGAIRSGMAYDQLFKGNVVINFHPLGLWSGGQLSISAEQISSTQPSVHEIGDLQVASNISAKPALRIYSFSYSQRIFPSLVLKAGLIDMNKYFAYANDASILLNSSFGIEPDISANVPVSIFPKPGLGIYGVDSFDHWKIRGSIFQNNPADRSDFSLHRYMATLEIDYQTNIGVKHKPLTLKMGFWHHTPITNGVQKPSHLHNGYYFIAQQAINTNQIRNTNVFMQWGSSPYQFSAVPYYLGLGLLIKHPFISRPRDQFSFGIAKAWTNLSLSDAETSYEMTYSMHINSTITIQPDFQFIQHPSGRLHSNSIVTFLRCILSIK